MKKWLIIHTVLFCGALHMTAHAASVIWPAVGMGRIDESHYGIGTGVSPAGGATIGIELLIGAGSDVSMQTYDMTLGIRQLWFASEYGAAVDSSALADADFLANLEMEDFGPIGVPLNQVFYLGFQLDGPPAPDYPHPPLYYVYGWASLLWDGTELTLVDSAAETTGVGIYAGTYDAIPEPSAAGLLLVGIAAALLRRRRPHSSLRSGDGG